MIDDERIYLPTSPSNHIPHGLAYVHALPMVRQRIVADLCCGTGYGTRLLSESAKFVTGYDYSKEAIEYNQTRLLPNVKFVFADVEVERELDVEVITCMQGLEHLEDPRALIHKHLDKVWIVALPHDHNLNNEHHHHLIDEKNDSGLV
jgi:2-polyprenyl-3-methyl-5-hydroxy-6-metoxy-1,4-benzoquinol methylase